MEQSRTDAPPQDASRCCDQNRSTQTKRRDETSLRLRTLSPGIHLSFARRHETFVAIGQLAAAELAALRAGATSKLSSLNLRGSLSNWATDCCAYCSSNAKTVVKTSN